MGAAHGNATAAGRKAREDDALRGGFTLECAFRLFDKWPIDSIQTQFARHPCVCRLYDQHDLLVYPVVDTGGHQDAAADSASAARINPRNNGDW